jgi:hypothetical protein
MLFLNPSFVYFEIKYPIQNEIITEIQKKILLYLKALKLCDPFTVNDVENNHVTIKHIRPKIIKIVFMFQI